MSFYLRSASRATLAARPAVSFRTFTARSALMLKETDRDNPDQPEKNEKHIKDQLQKQKEGKNHWKQELASNSEEAVAADRNAKDKSPEQLQHETKDHAEEKHKAGTSQSSGF